MNFKKIILLMTFFLGCFSVIAGEKKLGVNNTEFNVYTGMFDFSDDGKRSTLVGVSASK